MHSIIVVRMFFVLRSNDLATPEGCKADNLGNGCIAKWFTRQGRLLILEMTGQCHGQESNR